MILNPSTTELYLTHSVCLCRVPQKQNLTRTFTYTWFITEALPVWKWGERKMMIMTVCYFRQSPSLSRSCKRVPRSSRPHSSFPTQAPEWLSHSTQSGLWGEASELPGPAGVIKGQTAQKQERGHTEMVRGAPGDLSRAFAPTEWHGGELHWTEQGCKPSLQGSTKLSL